MDAARLAARLATGRGSLGVYVEQRRGSALRLQSTALGFSYQRSVPTDDRGWARTSFVAEGDAARESAAERCGAMRSDAERIGAERCEADQVWSDAERIGLLETSGDTARLICSG